MEIENKNIIFMTLKFIKKPNYSKDMTFDDFIVFPLDNPNNFYKDNFCLICSSKFDTEDIEKLLPYNRSSYLINTYFHLPDS